MSTGLTFVSTWDYSNTSLSGFNSYTFNDYSEAIKWSLYTARSLSANVTANPGVFFIIYTTSPNPNGYVDGNTGTPAFTPWD